MGKIPAFFITLINVIFGLMETLIGMRIILKLFGANPGTPFVSWIYETSSPVLFPFSNIFPSPQLDGRFTIEFSALFALIIYYIVNYLIVELIKAINRTAKGAGAA